VTVLLFENKGMGEREREREREKVASNNSITPGNTYKKAGQRPVYRPREVMLLKFPSRRKPIECQTVWNGV